MAEGGKQPQPKSGGGSGKGIPFGPKRLGGAAKNQAKAAWSYINPQKRDTKLTNARKKATKAGLKTVRLAFSAAKATSKILLRPGPHQPFGWIAFAILFLGFFVALTILLYMAAGGLFAPDVAERASPVVTQRIAAHDDIPEIYLAAYKEAAEQHDIPWEILAAWGWVATDHGKRSPYDCIWRIDNGSPLAWTPEIKAAVENFLGDSTVNVFGNSSSAGIYMGSSEESKEAAQYLKERNSIQAESSVTLVFSPSDETRSWQQPSDIGDRDQCDKRSGSPSGWNTHFCPNNAGLPATSADPPIAPTEYTETAGYIYYPAGWQETNGCTAASGSYDWSGLVSARSSGGKKVLCGAMLIEADIPSGRTCYQLQSIEYSADIAAEEIARYLDEQNNDEYTNPLTPYEFHTPSLGDNQETLYPFGDMWGEDANTGQIMRGSAGMLPGYWGKAVEGVMQRISDPMIGRIGRCPDRTEEDRTDLQLLSETGTPSRLKGERELTPSEIFAGELQCEMSRTGAPMYHDWRGYALPHRGYASGRLAASLWARDAVQASWMWNKWEGQRNSGCRDTGDVAELGSAKNMPLNYSGMFLPFPPPRWLEDGTNAVMKLDVQVDNMSEENLKVSQYTNDFAPDNRPCHERFTEDAENPDRRNKPTDEEDLSESELRVREAKLAVENWQTMGWGGFYRKTASQCYLTPPKESYLLPTDTDIRTQAAPKAHKSDIDYDSDKHRGIMGEKDQCYTMPCSASDFELEIGGAGQSANDTNLIRGISYGSYVGAASYLNYKWKVKTWQTRVVDGEEVTIFCPTASYLRKGTRNSYWRLLQGNIEETSTQSEQIFVKDGYEFAKFTFEPEEDDIVDIGEVDLVLSKGHPPRCIPESGDRGTWNCNIFRFIGGEIHAVTWQEALEAGKTPELTNRDTNSEEFKRWIRLPATINGIYELASDMAKDWNARADVIAWKPFSEDSKYPKIMVQALFWNPNMKANGNEDLGEKYALFSPCVSPMHPDYDDIKIVQCEDNKDNPEFTTAPVCGNLYYDTATNPNTVRTASICEDDTSEVFSIVLNGWQQRPPSSLRESLTRVEGFRRVPPYEAFNSWPSSLFSGYRSDSITNNSYCRTVTISDVLAAREKVQEESETIEEIQARLAVLSEEIDSLRTKLRGLNAQLLLPAFTDAAKTALENEKSSIRSKIRGKQLEQHYLRRTEKGLGVLSLNIAFIEQDFLFWSDLREANKHRAASKRIDSGRIISITQPPTRPSQECTAGFIASTDFQKRPWLPSVAYPQVSAPSPHSWTGWVTYDFLGSYGGSIGHVFDGRPSHLELRSDVSTGYGWNAGFEVAHRARWLSGGVQQEDGQVVAIGPRTCEDGPCRIDAERNYIVQPQISKYQICAPRKDDVVPNHAAFTDYEQDRISDHPEHFFFHIHSSKSEDVGACTSICRDALIVAGAICRAYTEMVERAAIDGIELRGYGWRNQASQVETLIGNCISAGDSESEDYIDRMFSEGENTRPSGCNTALPGRSWHELASAVDFVDSEGETLDENDIEYFWLTQHAWRWGFLNLTGEPWHWSPSGA